jgi:parallel beta-helix repeat protein
VETDGGGTTELSGNVTTSGTQTYNDAVQLTAPITLTTTDSAVLFGGTVDGAEGLTVSSGTGNVTFNGAVGSITALDAITINSTGTTLFSSTVQAASVETDGGGTTELSGNVTTSGTQTYNDAVQLTAPMVVLTGSLVTLTGVDGQKANALKVDGNADIQAAIADITTLDVTGTSNVAADVTSSGTQTYSGVMTLDAALVTLTGSTVTLAGVDGQTTNALKVDGNADIKSAITGVTTVDVTGTSTVAADVTSSGNQTFGGLMTLAADVNLTSSAGVVELNGVDGQTTNALTVTGAADIKSAITGATTVAVTGTSTVAADVTSSGNQTFGDLMTLAADVNLTSSAGVVELNGVDGQTTNALTVTGAADIQAAITGVTTVNVTGTSTLAADVTSSGTQTYGGLVTLATDVTLTASTGVFTTGVNGANNDLTLDFSGVAAIDGATFQNIKNLASSNTKTGVTTLTGALTTTGTQTYSNAVTLVGATTLDGAGITFSDTLDGAETLVINDSGATIFAAAVGGTTPLASLTTGSGGTTTINGGSVTTTGIQTYGAAVTLGAATAITTTDSTVTFANTLDGTTAGIETLDITAGTGNVVFGDAVGGGTPFGTITITSAADLTAAAITASSLTHTAGTGTATFNGAQNYDTATGLTVESAGVALNAAVTTTNSGIVLLEANAGTLTIAAAGDILADGAVTLTGSAGISTAGDVTTTDDNVQFASATTLTGPVAISSGAGAGDISFASTLDGAQRMTVAAGTGAVTFTGAVGNTTALGGLAITSAASVTASDVVKLDGSTFANVDGLVFAAGVNNISMTKSGSSVTGFTGSSNAGILLHGGTTGSTLGGFTVSGNRGGIVAYAGDYTGSTITSSTIAGNSNNGIMLFGVDNLAVTNSRLSGNSGTGITVTNDGASVSEGVSLVGNSIGVNAAGTGAEQNTSYGIRLVGTVNTLIDDSVVSGNKLDGIYIEAAATGTTITDSFLGTNLGGTTAIANGQSGILVVNANATTLTNVNSSQNSLHGLFLRGTSSGTTVSGSVFAGNASSGIVLNNSVANTSVTGSKIGVTSTGAAGGNKVHGVIITTTGENTVFKSNTISNNGQHGVFASAARGGEIGGTGKADGNQISKNGVNGINLQGVLNGTALMRVGSNTITQNRIGMSLTNTTGVEVVSGLHTQNTQNGIYASGAFTTTSIRGVSLRANPNGFRLVSARNLSIDGTIAAIRLENNGSSGALINGDSTGTTIQGVISIGGQYGVTINDLSGRTTTNLTVANNIILNASIAGVYVNSGTAQGCVIKGNTLSGNYTGVLVLGSQSVVGSLTGITTVDLDGNIITASKTYGIRVTGAAAVNNPILSNSLYGNTLGGIFLSSGGNANQAAPSVTSSAIVGSEISIVGSLTAAAGSYRIQYFSSLATDATSASRVEGRTLLGYQDVTIGGSGVGTTSISQAFAQGDILAGDWISTTATSLVSGTPRNTSAFSLGSKVV